MKRVLFAAVPLAAACQAERPPESAPWAERAPESAPVAVAATTPPDVEPQREPMPMVMRELPLGVPQRLDAGTSYRVTGTDLVVRSRGAAMTQEAYAPSTLFVFVPLDAWRDGQSGEGALLRLRNNVPVRWGGYQFVASEYGFSKGQTSAYVTIRASE